MKLSTPEEAIKRLRVKLEALKRGEGIPKRDRERLAKAKMQGHYKVIQSYLDRAEEELANIKNSRDIDFVHVLIHAAEARILIAFYTPYIMRDEEGLMTRAKNRSRRFSAELVVSEIKSNLKPESLDELLQKWKDGITEFGEHGIECEYAGGKYQAYVSNDQSRFYSPSKTWEWTERTIRDNW